MCSRTGSERPTKGGGVRLWELSVAELADLFARREISPVEVTSSVLERVQEIDPVIRAFCTVTNEGALRAARDSERRVLAGESLGPCDGVPFSVKDTITTPLVSGPHSAHG